MPVGWGSPHLQSPRRRCGLPRQSSNPHVSFSRGNERDDSCTDSEGGASPTLRHEHEGHLAPTGVASTIARGTRALQVSGSNQHPAQLLALTGACRARHCAYDAPPGVPPRSAQCRCRAPPAVHSPGAALHAARQAAGVPSARSQPAPVTPARPRRWGDAGTTAAPAAADQKAGAPGRQCSDQRSESAGSDSGSRQQSATSSPVA